MRSEEWRGDARGRWAPRGKSCWPALAALVFVLAACAPAATPAAPAPTAAAKPVAPASGSGASGTAAGTAAGSAPSGDAAPAGARPGAPQDVRDAANREGQLRLYWTGTATDQWRQRFQDAMNALYGVQVSIADTRGNDWGRDTANIIAESLAGQRPAFDVMLTTEAHYNDLHHAGLLGQYEWTAQFGVPPRAVLFKNGAFAFAHQLVLPAYNRDVAAADAPRTWDDLLEPRWKDRIGVSSANHQWARLSQAWGDERTTRFVERLAAQNPRLGSLADLNQRLQLGEIHVVATMIDNLIKVSRERGAPVEWAEAVQPVIAQSLVAGPLKGAANPNAALLFAGFLASKEGQELWQEFQGQSSVFVEGSAYWQFVQGKEYVVLQEDFMEKELEARTAKYGRMLGYR
jgi:iron(III) transport system substrate-binding protein